MAAAIAGRHLAEQGGGGTVRRFGLVSAEVDALRAAVANGQIRPYYQPIVSMTDGQTLGGEALARWEHPQRGLVPPDEFIPIAEQCGLIDAIGEQILRQACRDAAGWVSPDRVPPKVTVNVSGQQLHRPEFVDIALSALADSGLPAARLVLEVTESTVYGDDVLAHAAIVRLRAHGIAIAIDDFGTGYSNLGRLASLPVDLIKFDRSFLLDIETNPRSRALLRGLLSMTGELDLATVFEGIETDAQADRVRALGVQQAQGWLWGQAVPNAQFPLYLPALLVV